MMGVCEGDRAVIRVKPPSPPTPWVIEAARLEPELDARLRAALAPDALNAKWYEAHIDAIRQEYAGRYVAVVGGQVFAGSTAEEAEAAARSAHPQAYSSAFRVYVRPQPAE
jgi:hypothetical protein